MKARGEEKKLKKSRANERLEHRLETEGKDMRQPVHWRPVLKRNTERIQGRMGDA